ncbi:hypothetical protein U0070_013250 [Myodes glareolus]|uniref:Uncharacterized protein n=1 Tax=Myodes glareolus TaxID=447135 RepID=A0AAW0I3Z9_MYOGA
MGADSLYRDSFSFSDEKLNSPTDSTPALLTSTVAPRKAKLAASGDWTVVQPPICNGSGDSRDRAA